MNWLSQFFSSLVKPFKCWVVVAQWERGVRVRLGKDAVEFLPGFHWRIPFLDRIYVQSVRLRTVAETNQTVGTSDGRTLVVSIAVRFSVRDMLKLYDSLSNPEVAIGQLALATVAQIVTTAHSGTLTASSLEAAVNERLGELETFGLADVRLLVTGFAYVRTYRLISNDYRTGAGLSDLERDHSGER